MNEEEVRLAVAAIKRHLYSGGSAVYLPADSFIAKAAREVLSIGIASKKRSAQLMSGEAREQS